MNNFEEIFMNDGGTQVKVVHFQRGDEPMRRGGEIASSSYFFISPPPNRNAFHHFCHCWKLKRKKHKSAGWLAGWLECIRHWLCSFGLINVIFFYDDFRCTMCKRYRKLRVWIANFKIKNAIEVIWGWPTLLKKSRACRRTNFVRLSAICWHEFRGRFVDNFLLQDNIYVIKRCDKKVDIFGEVILSNRRSNCVRVCACC